jgi:hypothetical protein
VCADVIEHLLNPLPLLASVISELQQGGTLIISTPDREGLRGSRNRHSPKAEHVREWSKSEFRELIKQTGLRIIDHRSSPPWSYYFDRRATARVATLASSCKISWRTDTRGTAGVTTVVRTGGQGVQQ